MKWLVVCFIDEVPWYLVLGRVGNDSPLTIGSGLFISLPELINMQTLSKHTEYQPSELLRTRAEDLYDDSYNHYKQAHKKLHKIDEKR